MSIILATLPEAMQETPQLYLHPIPPCVLHFPLAHAFRTLVSARRSFHVVVRVERVVVFLHVRALKTERVLHPFASFFLSTSAPNARHLAAWHAAFAPAEFASIIEPKVYSPRAALLFTLLWKELL